MSREGDELQLALGDFWHEANEPQTRLHGSCVLTLREDGSFEAREDPGVSAPVSGQN